MKEKFIANSTKALSRIFDEIERCPSLDLHTLDPKTTALLIVDMVNGFATTGPLSSPRIDALTPRIAQLSRQMDRLGIQKIAFADHHTEDSPEFKSFPPHCLSGTEESEVVTPIREVGNYRLIKKNSTNGYLEPEFQAWLKEHKEVATFILVGDCTDICILQLALSLKTHFNRLNLESRIIVPSTHVDTYDLGSHQGDLLHLMGLYLLMTNAVEVVKNLEF